MTTIYATAGNKRYVGGTITETSGASIASATFVVALSSSNTVPPTVWVAPTVSTQGDTTADRVLKFLIDSNTSAGSYFLWARVTDTPEIEPLVLTSQFTVV